MAVTVNKDNVKVGMLVYEFGYPTNPGIIRKIINTTGYFPMCQVEWLKATKNRAKISNTCHLNDFESLIEDHRRKHSNQTKLAQRLRNMP